MTEASERAVALVAGSTAHDEGEDLLAGARLRTQLALATTSAARLRAPVPDPDRTVPGRLRWRVGRRLAVAAGLVLLLTGAGAAWRSWAGAAQTVLVSLEQPAGASGEAAETGAAELVVHVVGAVRSPGVVHVPAGSRVADALDAAGGAGPDADLAAVNLARLLADGEQVVVPGVAAEGTGPPADGLVDLNAADAQALDALPGIGPVLAARIVAWRTAHGRFSSVDELAEVTGIGPALLAGLRDLVRV